MGRFPSGFLQPGAGVDRQGKIPDFAGTLHEGTERKSERVCPPRQAPEASSWPWHRAGSQRWLSGPGNGRKTTWLVITTLESNRECWERSFKIFSLSYLGYTS